MATNDENTEKIATFSQEEKERKMEWGKMRIFKFSMTICSHSECFIPKHKKRLKNLKV